MHIIKNIDVLSQLTFNVIIILKVLMPLFSVHQAGYNIGKPALLCRLQTARAYLIV